MRAKPALVILILACSAQARGPRFYEKGTVTEMTAVDCGYEEKGAPGAAGVLLGTGDEHKKTEKLLCQEYVLNTERVVYKIRPKDSKHPRLLPVGSEAEFRIAKDHMYLRVPELGDKERQYVVTSMAPRTQANASSPAGVGKTSPK